MSRFVFFRRHEKATSPRLVNMLWTCYFRERSVIAYKLRHFLCCLLVFDIATLCQLIALHIHRRLHDQPVMARARLAGRDLANVCMDACGSLDVTCTAQHPVGDFRSTKPSSML